MNELLRLLKYPGAKTKILQELYSYFPPHYTYVEPFVGSYAVILNKERSTIEWVNDIDAGLEALAYCYLICPDKLLKAIEYDLHSQALFKFLKRVDYSEKTMLEKALQKLYVIYHSFSALGENFSYMLNETRYMDIKLTKDSVNAVHERLKNVHIFSEDFRVFLKRLKHGKQVFIYLDPPYIITVRRAHYSHNFFEKDHYDLKEILAQFNSKNIKWLMSYDKMPLIDSLYSDFFINEIEVPYNLARSARNNSTELLISNYDLKQLEKPKPSQLGKFLEPAKVEEEG